jgi:hypothetical protein
LEQDESQVMVSTPSLVKLLLPALTMPVTDAKALQVRLGRLRHTSHSHSRRRRRRPAADGRAASWSTLPHPLPSMHHAACPPARINTDMPAVCRCYPQSLLEQALQRAKSVRSERGEQARTAITMALSCIGLNAEGDIGRAKQLVCTMLQSSLVLVSYGPGGPPSPRPEGGPPPAAGGAALRGGGGGGGGAAAAAAAAASGRRPAAARRRQLCSAGPPREQLLRHRIQVYWPGDGRWYPGTVSAYDGEARLHRVDYEDGESYTHELAEAAWRLAPAAAAAADHGHGHPARGGGQIAMA